MVKTIDRINMKKKNRRWKQRKRDRGEEREREKNERERLRRSLGKCSVFKANSIHHYISPVNTSEMSLTYKN